MKQNNQDLNNNPQGNNNTTSKIYTTSKDMVYCSKCGRQIPKESKYCIYCGEVNVLSEKNEKMNPFFAKGKRIRQKEEKKQINSINNPVANATIDKNEVTRKEKMYTSWKHFKNIIVIMIFIFLVINYQTVLNFVDNFRKQSYIKQVQKMVNQIQQEYESGRCYSTSEDGRLYYSFESSDGYFNTLVSFYTFDYFKGYIEIIKHSNGTNGFVVNITDGKYGIENVLSSELTIKDVKKLENVDLPKGRLICQPED